ncbi:MAG: hypothetical protein U9Q82_13960, partial [Chloroflexota bacterium]|nr:hypothetical protein [Chloroflexota bacterium]
FKIINPDNGHVLGYSQADLVNGVYGVDSGAAITVLTKTRLRKSSDAFLLAKYVVRDFRSLASSL